MDATWNETPSANRLHIGVFGKTNSGKSSFINAFTGQEVSIVADVAGTTTDPVYKAMEIYPMGPCTIMDTAGFDDESTLGEQRVERTRLAAQKADLAIIVFSACPVCGESYDEKGHEERYLAFVNNIENMTVFAKEGEVVWQCRNCGYITVGKEAPEVCPACLHPQAYFEVKKENY